ncbi:ParA family protein [Myxococcus sp. CA051A]|uniref:ParA family protein n=1 Tax=Myxococcus sp. CA051A TaxID=2741739 RepID=UPI00157A9010|nr:ParA family protein [Myxococcus sp. CA051A]
MVRKITVMNHKGGVAKTTTSVELATALALLGKRVLLLDFDQQANASQALNLHPENLNDQVSRSKDLLMGGPFSPVRDHLTPGLDVVPSCLPLAAVERALEMKYPSVVARRRVLSDALKPHEASYDFIIADCPPALSLIVDNCLVGCPEIIVPVKLDPLSLSGALDLHAHVTELIQLSQPRLRFLGALGTFAKSRTTMTKRMLERLRHTYGAQTVFQTVIHLRESFVQATDMSHPLGLWRKRDPGAIEYMKLAQEVISRG